MAAISVFELPEDPFKRMGLARGILLVYLSRSHVGDRLTEDDLKRLRQAEIVLRPDAGAEVEVVPLPKERVGADAKDLPVETRSDVVEPVEPRLG